MPRLIKTSLSPGKYRGALESARSRKPIMKASRPGAQVASEILGITGAVMKHPVTDLIVTGISEWIDAGKEDVEGFKDLQKRRSEALRARAAEGRVRPQFKPLPERQSTVGGVPPGTPIEGIERAAGEEATRILQQQRAAQAAQSVAARPPSTPPLVDVTDVPEQLPETMRAADLPPAEVPVEVPRGVEEILAFISSPVATPEDLDWALKQVARFSPVRSLSDIGRPKMEYTDAVLKAYERATKRTPTIEDRRKQALEEAKYEKGSQTAMDARALKKEQQAIAASKSIMDRKAQERRARIIASGKDADRQRKRQGERDNATWAINNAHDLGALARRIIDSREYSRSNLKKLKEGWDEVKKGLKEATQGAHRYQRGLRSQHEHIWASRAREGYNDGAHPAYENLKEMDSSMIRLISEMESAVKAAESAERRIEQKKESKQATLTRLETDLSSSEELLGSAEAALKRVLSATPQDRKSLRFDSRLSEYVASTKKGPKTKGVKDAYNAYRQALKARNKAEANLGAFKHVTGDE